MRLTDNDRLETASSDRALPRIAILLVGSLVALALTGVGGLVLVGVKGMKAGREAAAVSSRPGPVFAPLPPFEFALAEGGRIRQVDINVVLELPSGADRKQIDSQVPRIVNALNSRLVEFDPKDLRGPSGTQMVKDVVSVAANRELRPMRVQQVLLQKLVLY